MKVDATVARQFVMLRYPACVGKVVVESSQTLSHLYLCQGKSPLASNIINSVKKVACECAHLACTSFNFFFCKWGEFFFWSIQFKQNVVKPAHNTQTFNNKTMYDCFYCRSPDLSSFEWPQFPSYALINETVAIRQDFRSKQMKIWNSISCSQCPTEICDASTCDCASKLSDDLLH